MKKVFILFLLFLFLYSKPPGISVIADSFPDVVIKITNNKEIKDLRLFENSQEITNYNLSLIQDLVVGYDTIAIMFLVDASGNVGDSEQVIIKTALNKLISSYKNIFPKSILISAYYFHTTDNKGNTLRGLRGFVSKPELLQGIENRIIFRDSLYRCDLYKAIYDGADKFKNLRTQKRIMILLTAGRNNSPANLTKDDVIQKLKIENITPLIFIVNTASGVAGEELRIIADINNGIFLRAYSPNDIIKKVSGFFKNLKTQKKEYFYELSYTSPSEADSSITVKLIINGKEYEVSYKPVIKIKEKKTIITSNIVWIFLGVTGVVLSLVVIILYKKFSKNNPPKTSETDFSKTIITNVPSQTYNLEFISGNEKGVIPLNKEGEWYIGRTPDNDIVLNDMTVSKKHAKIILLKNKLYIVDLNSTNGVIVNSESVEKKELKKGDIIKLGESIIKVK